MWHFQNPIRHYLLLTIKLKYCNWCNCKGGIDFSNTIKYCIAIKLATLSSVDGKICFNFNVKSYTTLFLGGGPRTIFSEPL